MDTLLAAISSVPFDGSDPLVALLAWGLAWLVHRYAPKAWSRWVRRLTPTVAVLLAVFLRAAWAVSQDEPFTVQVLLRAVAAGAVAVLGHSQIREVVKAVQPPPTEGEGSPSGKPPAP